MPSAGRYPIVRGKTTLPQFFAKLQAQPRPEGAFNMRSWLRSSGLVSSYFDDIRPFATFIGLTNDGGTTDLWAALRDNDKFSGALTTALQTAYTDPLGFLGISTPTGDDATRLSNRLRTSENVQAAEALAAAETMIAAFDLALGRVASEVPGTVARTAQLTARGRRPTPNGAARPTGSKRGAAPAVPSTAHTPGAPFAATLAINLQIVLPADAPDDRYDAMLGAVARHLGPLLSHSA